MMTPRRFRIELRQAAPNPGDLAGNTDSVIRALDSCTAELLVFPELFLSGYDTQHLDELALAIGDPRIAQLADACRRAHVALMVGFAERDGTGFYDSYLAIDHDGTVLEPIRKTHLFGTEGEVFLAGNILAPITLMGIRIGVLNCFELEFPEIARTLALRGAEMLVCGSANMHPYGLDHRIATQSRAIENRLPLAYVNRIGEQDGHRFCGLSRLVDPDGTTRRQLGEAETASICDEVTIGFSPAGEVDMLAQRRPELYAS
jgi:predicted amidohydrolase